MKRVAVVVLLLAVLGVAACGRDEPEAPAPEVQVGEASQGEGRVRTEPWVGYWESAARSEGGIGSAMYIRPTGDALFWMCVLAGGPYAMDGDRLTFGGETKSVRVQIDGDHMTQIAEGGENLEMTRMGTGKGIVGDWRYEHYVGQEAFQRFDADGTLVFRLIMGPIVIRRYEPLGEDGIALKAGKKLKRAELHLRAGELVTEDGEPYVRVGEKPWYPLP